MTERPLPFSPPLRILVTGSRMWDKPGLIHHVLDEAARDWCGEVVIVHGQCDPRDKLGKVVPWERALTYDDFLLGADWHADRYAVARGWTREPYRAKWDLYGNSAGHRRNAEMVALGANLCVGFPLGDSPGTRGCVGMALKAHIPVRTEEG